VGRVLVLASASPRRADLLRTLGLEFTVRAVPVDEQPPPGLGPDEAAKAIAERKLAAAALAPDEFGLAADTLVVLSGRLVGKPADAADAKRILTSLSGRIHEVVTGLVVARGGQRVSAAVTTHVDFAALSPKQIDAYVATGEPLDKAGAYGIQGRAAAFIRAVRGDPSNVVGLPVRRTIELLHEIGYALPAHLRPA
jgi:nucleoside triphosphate pyrophosphatase